MARPRKDETPEERAAREKRTKKNAADRQRRRVASETPEQKRRRLDMKNERQRRTVRTETPAHRAHRIAVLNAGSRRYRRTPKGEANKAKEIERKRVTGRGAEAQARHRARKIEREREAARQETRQQTRQEREARQMRRRKIVKPPRRPAYRGIPGYNSGGNAVSRRAFVKGEPTPWLTEAETPAEGDVEKLLAWVWEGLTRNEIIWGRKQIEAEESYIKKLLGWRGIRRVSKVSRGKRRAKSPSKHREMRIRTGR